MSIEEATPETRISILIRTYNSATTLEKVLDGLDGMEGDQWIVVDSGSTDATLQIAEDFGAEIIRAEGTFHYSKSLNLGFQAARCPWVLVLSSHCLPTRSDILGQFRKAMTLHCEPFAVIYGKSSLYELPDTGFEANMGNLELWRKKEYRPGANTIAMYSRSCWERHPFSCDIPTAEDHEWFLWAMNAGYSACSLPNAVVLYRNKGSLIHMFKKGITENLTLHKIYGDLKPKTPFRTFSRHSIRAIRDYFALYRESKIDFGTCCRMISHRLGAWYSNGI